MGSGMAANIAQSSHDVIVYDAYEPAASRLAEHGARVAESIGQLVRESDVVFTSLPGPVQVEEVALGPDGILAHSRRGTAYFDLSTNAYSLVMRLNREFAAAGVAMLDAPISGGPAGAASGDLVVWVGGDRDVYDRHLDVLESFSSPARYVGGPGAGTITKLAHNLLGNLILTSLAEVFTLGVKGGVDPLDLWEAMRLGLVGKRSPLDMVVNQFLPGKYEPPAMQLKLGHKDIGLAVSLAKELGVPMRLSSLVLEELTEAIGRGWGDQDSRAFMKLQVERAGVEIAVDPELLRAAVERKR
jgi:3-hydroxyisobutyrate dehydrogenase